MVPQPDQMPSAHAIDYIISRAEPSPPAQVDMLHRGLASVKQQRWYGSVGLEMCFLGLSAWSRHALVEAKFVETFLTALQTNLDAKCVELGLPVEFFWKQLTALDEQTMLRRAEAYVSAHRSSIPPSILLGWWLQRAMPPVQRSSPPRSCRVVGLVGRVHI